MLMASVRIWNELEKSPAITTVTPKENGDAFANRTAQEGNSITDEQLANAQRYAAQKFPVEARSTFLLSTAIMAAGSKNAADVAGSGK
jgi:hypothetical protein